MNALAPQTLAILPGEMRAARRWMLWKSIPQDGGKKPRKVPHYANGARRSGKLDDPEDAAKLATFEEAVSALSCGGYTGLGFALGPDGTGQVWQGIDLDGLPQRPELEPIARELPGYVETSPSGNGLHAIGYGRPFASMGSNPSGIEAYSSGRYFTVTGECISHNAPVDIADFVETELRPIHASHSARGAPTPVSRIEGAATPQTSGSTSGSVPTFGSDVIVTPRLLADLRDALSHIEAHDQGTWSDIGHALKTLGEPGKGVWLDWSATSWKYNHDVAQKTWASFKPERTGYAAVFAKATRLGWQNPAARADQAQERRSEEELAQAFAQENQAGLRYCAKWGKWLTWDQVKWSVDETLLAIDHARNLCRRVAAASGNERAALNLGKGNTISAVVALARADRRLAATSDQWDADPMLLNTPGGVVDLKTGEIRPCDPTLHMTKVTGTAAGGDCPTWLRVLDRITGGDAELQAYLQRVFGYALTGDTSAHALFFFYGTGANGKSVVINTLAGVLGDYHKTAPIETFTESKNERHSTELAMLRGSRLVTAAETEEGRHWAETKIKTLTGGDRISARFMYRDNFEFTPCFKLIVAGNHKPGLRTADEAMRRRIHMIPFAVTIPAEERDPQLTERLGAEWPGILTWMIAGCQEWQRIGLSPPAAVLAATEAYLVGEDSLSAWMEEMCEGDLQAWEPSGDLFASWKVWAEARGEPGGTHRRLTLALEARGFLQLRKSQARGVVGLRLKKAPEFDERCSA